MARGIILGSVTNSVGDPMSGDVSLSSIRGGDSNGILVQYSVPMIEQKVGSWPFDTKVKVASRKLVAGCFAIPFSWPTTPDNLARAAAVDLLDVKVTVMDESSNYKTFWGKAAKVIDGVQFVNNVKAGKVMMSGSPEDILKSLKPDLKKAIKGDELDQIPYTLLSVDQIAILGLMPGLQF
ncbi:hypothetical protein [Zavarzinia sp.]|uniref:hypothetical protein n=1 Tax=Zavarzinia sp. TaxID=2027920 RepID=UPI0035661364